MKLRAGFVGLVIAIVTTWIAAAASLRPNEDRADLGAPGEEHKVLDALAGTWDVTVRFPIGPGKHMEGSSRCEAHWVMEGRFVRLEYASEFAGKPLSIVRYVGFDRHERKFVEVQFESTHTDVMHTEGSASADGRSITCSGTHVDVAIDKEVQVRTVTTFVDPKTFTLDVEYGEAGDAAAKTITLTHRRR
jgi:hypothetical protein